MRAVPFDADSLSVTGGSVPLLDRIMIKRAGAANLDISDNGRLVFARGATVDPLAPQAVQCPLTHRRLCPLRRAALRVAA